MIQRILDHYQLPGSRASLIAVVYGFNGCKYIVYCMSLYLVSGYKSDLNPQTPTPLPPSLTAFLVFYHRLRVCGGDAPT